LQFSWQGIEIEIRFERNWLGSPPSDYRPSHPEVEAVASVFGQTYPHIIASTDNSALVLSPLISLPRRWLGDQQAIGRGAKSYCQARQHRDCHIPLPAFHLRNIGPIHTRLVRQLLLRQAGLNTGAPNIGGRDFNDACVVRWSHT
jgi:hypothetical protein